MSGLNADKSQSILHLSVHVLSGSPLTAATDRAVNLSTQIEQVLSNRYTYMTYQCAVALREYRWPVAQSRFSPPDPPTWHATPTHPVAIWEGQDKAVRF